MRTLMLCGGALVLSVVDRWATIEARRTLTIGLHPASAPAPGTKGAVTVGFDVGIPIDAALKRLVEHGVRLTGDVIRAEGGAFLSIEDPDGNPIYLWEKSTMVKATERTDEPVSAGA